MKKKTNEKVCMKYIKCEHCKRYEKCFEKELKEERAKKEGGANCVNSMMKV